jgi:hypothetical protein
MIDVVIFAVVFFGIIFLWLMIMPMVLAFETILAQRGFKPFEWYNRWLNYWMKWGEK